MECSWELEPERDHEQRVIPDGCMDIVWSPAAGLQVAGPNTVAFVTPIPGGSDAVGVRLHPGAGPSLLGVVAPALRDAGPAATEVWGARAARLEEAVERATGPRRRADLMLAWLAGRARQAAPPDPLVAALAGRLRADPGLAVSGLAGDLGIGERHLRRRVVSAVGYGPKRLGRVLRLRGALALSRREPDLGWAGVAYRSGYADQAHLTHDCAALAGVPPTRLAPEG